MLIDWFTVCAQAVNFLLLVWLLKHFLYQPILSAIDAREKGIATQLADAAARQTDAKKVRDEFQDKTKAFDLQRGALLAKAAGDAKTERDRLFDEARKDTDALRAAQSMALQNDQNRLGNEITRVAQEEVFAIVRKTLADLATATLEERVGAVFTRRLSELNGDAKRTLSAALRTSSEPTLVQTAFDLPAEQRATIQNAVNETFAAAIPLRFETAPSKICGIELTSNGQKIGWSIADYLATLKQKVNDIVDTQPPLKAKAQGVSK